LVAADVNRKCARHSNTRIPAKVIAFVVIPHGADYIQEYVVGKKGKDTFGEPPWSFTSKYAAEKQDETLIANRLDRRAIAIIGETNAKWYDAGRSEALLLQQLRRKSTVGNEAIDAGSMLAKPCVSLVCAWPDS
jgi:hypothetical protein